LSYGPARSVDAHDADAGGHFAMWFLGVVGALLIAAGLWLSFAPPSGELTLGFVSFDVTDIPDLLGPGLLAGGGALVAGAMFTGAYRDWWFDEGWVLVTIQVILGLIGLAAAVLGVFGLLDRLGWYSLPGLPI
jgi:hypothetical protein